MRTFAGVCTDLSRFALIGARCPANYNLISVRAGFRNSGLSGEVPTRPQEPRFFGKMLADGLKFSVRFQGWFRSDAHMAKLPLKLKPVAQTSYSSRQFLLDDLPKTLFPLSTNRVLIDFGSQEIHAHIENILSGKSAFLPQRRVHANKDEFHLRRTVKLDPVAEYYIYDLIYRNRGIFTRPKSIFRRHHGYRFEDGLPISASKSYADFKLDVWSGAQLNKRFIGFDIASYFNGIYHHDLHAWFSSKGVHDSDAEGFGKYLRQINAGRSLDCLPQGLYPTKMIGNDLLRFIEESAFIRCAQVCRFMDDVYLFDDDESVLKADFAEIQRLLGLKGLSVNASKTEHGDKPRTDEADDQLSELKKSLLKRRRQLIVTQYDDVIEGEVEEERLEKEELDFILELLNGNLSEEDAELILIVARKNILEIEPHIDKFSAFPHLVKNFYALCQDAVDKDRVTKIVLEAIKGKYVSEYQLFWFGMMLEGYLLDTTDAGSLLNALYTHPNASDISRAKLLEIPDTRYGLPELREGYLREGRSDWLAWSSAVGARSMNKAPRNYLLNYFAGGSEMNKLIAGIVSKTT